MLFCCPLSETTTSTLVTPLNPFSATTFTSVPFTVTVAIPSPEARLVLTEFEEFEVVALIFSKILMFTIFNSLLSELLIVTMATPGLRSEI